MNRKVGCTAIGDYLQPLKRPLREKGIWLDVTIPHISPLAMAADRDESNLQYCEDQKMRMPMVLNLRKNLSQMLSRDPNYFCENYNWQPRGRRVRYQNDTDYIIIMNTSAGYSLYRKGDIVYSETLPQHPFVTGIAADKEYECLTFPFTNTFDWKYFYDKFIDTILAEYDKEHIILIRTNAAQWYMDANDIQAFDNRAAQYRNRVEQMDRYFMERTGCLCIDEHYNHIPHEYTDSVFPYAARGELFYKRLERCLEEIIDGKIDNYKINIPSSGSRLMSNLCWKLSSDTQKSNVEHMRFISDNCVSFSHLKNMGSNDFFRDLDKFERFLDLEHSYTLSDYVLERGSDISKVDMDLVRLYLKYMKLDINDIVAVYILSLHGMRLSELKEIAEILVNHSDCLPVLMAKEHRTRNIVYLQNYQYIQPELKEVDHTSKCMIWLGNSSYLVIDPCANIPIEKVELNIQNKVDHIKVIEDGYICPIESADALCASYAFYIERAKRSESNHPVKIIFDNREDFCKSLHFIDYTDILENENFVLSTSGYSEDIPDFSAKCSLVFLFEKNVRICKFTGGLADQVIFYIFAKQLEEASKPDPAQNRSIQYLYDDTYYLWCKVHNGFEIDQFATEDIGPRLLSKILSKKLLDQIDGFWRLPELLYTNGCTEVGGIVSPNCSRALERMVPCIVVNAPYFCRFDRLLQRTSDFQPPFYHIGPIWPDSYMKKDEFDPNKYIRFPDFEDKNNQSIARKMSSCDAVVIHIRRGDFVLAGRVDDNEFYYESIQKLLEIPDYPNKKYFIFSDDIPWAKAHRTEMGLDLVGDSEVVFVDHNKGERSYKDLQLMTLAKIIIASQSGFVRLAALLSTRCEQFISRRVLDLQHWKGEGTSTM